MICYSPLHREWIYEVQVELKRLHPAHTSFNVRYVQYMPCDMREMSIILHRFNVDVRFGRYNGQVSRDFAQLDILYVRQVLMHYLTMSNVFLS